MNISDRKHHNTLSLCFSSSWRSANSNSLLTISKSIEYGKWRRTTIPRMGSMLFSTWMISGSSKQRSTWRTISTPRMFPKNWFPINMNDHLRMMNGYPIHFLHWLLWQGLQYRWIASVPLQSFWIDWLLLISSNDHLELRWVQIKDTYRKQTIETKE